jgi:hypothetical protein
VQRSTDGTGWTTISAVPARNLEGLQDYTDWDHAPLKGHSYYRLRIIGNTGSADKYSATRNIYIDPGKLSFGVLPNPAKDQVRLEFQSNRAEQVLIRFYDISGRIVHSTRQSLVTGSNTIRFTEIAKWPPGIYLVAVHAGNENVLVQRFTILK